MSKRPRTIQIFLINGDPSGIRVAELTVSIVSVTEVPRSMLKEYTERPESSQYGIYFLVGGDEGNELYIGQSGDIRRRLEQHSKSDTKDWERALVLNSKTNNLTPTHALYLEALSIELAKTCGRYVLSNGNSGQKPFISESLKADCEDIHETASMLLTTLGYPIFEPLVTEEELNEDKVFFCKRSGANARAIFTNEGMVVLKGSIALAVPSAKKVKEDILKTREKLLAQGVLVIQGDKAVFTRDYLFKTPSGASNAVVIAASNGWTDWKTSQGQTLDEIYRSSGESKLS
jgi:hypothetical protein